MEDDDSVAELVARILYLLPLRVVRASSAAEAEMIFAEKRHSVGLAMIDFGLPDMDGRLLLRRLRRSVPQLPALLTSGCASHAAEKFTDAPTLFLPKPFFPGEVRRHVTSLLNAVA